MTVVVADTANYEAIKQVTPQDATTNRPCYWRQPGSPSIRVDRQLL